MATTWTNTITQGSPIRAFDIQEARDAINTNRTAAGLGAYSWTDPTLSAQITAVKALHLTQMRTAIQDLWTTKGMGTIPPWWAYGIDGDGPATGKPIFAQDLLDVRRWLNQYEAAPAAVTVSPLKGIHMPNSQFRAVDASALDEAIPSFGMLVALSEQFGLDQSHTTQSGNTVKMADVMGWYAANRGTELFVRLFPDPVPPGVPPSGAHQTTRSADNVADEVVRLYKKYNPDWAAQTNLRFARFIPGNEPNATWLAGSYAGFQWQNTSSTQLLQAINAYYTDVYNRLQDRKNADHRLDPIELYYPAMAQAVCAEGKFVQPDSIFKGISSYCDYGEVVATNDCSWTDETPRIGKIGYDWLQSSIELYNRFTWHNYFCSWHGFDHCVSRYFPQWLKNKLYGGGMVGRITECGWHPLVNKQGVLIPREKRDRDSGMDTSGQQQPYNQYACDDETISASNVLEGAYPQDLNFFITQSHDGRSPADGVAIWLLLTRA